MINTVLVRHGFFVARQNHHTANRRYTLSLQIERSVGKECIDNLQIVNGSMELVDKTTPEPFTYNLGKIEMSTDSLYSDKDWVTIYANMILNNRGKLVAELGYYPDDPMDLSVNYVITDFLLSDLNIYSRYYMGFPILYGDMYYKSETKILKGQLTSNNKLVIHNAELGDKGGGLYKLPLKFALFLLKDRNGVIDLDIPVI